MKQIHELIELAGKATPGPWRWRSFGREPMLVADHGGRDVVICEAKSRDDEHGLLVPMHENLPNSKFIAACSPEIIKAMAEVVLAADGWLQTNSRSQYFENQKLIDATKKLQALLEGE